MNNKEFNPHHINATPADLAGNNGIGRYILLPGSDGRAKEIAEHFDHLTIKPHPRGHNLYLGTIQSQTNRSIDVAVISTGMGCPSMEIILNELFQLGGKRFLRVGTAGSLQPDQVKIGDIVNVQGSVRDEATTADYVPIEVPAIASLELTSAILFAAERIGLSSAVHTGIVHCKSSFYARQFGLGPKSDINKNYMQLLTQCGVLASEMETAALFIQTQLYNHQAIQQGGPANRVLAGAILGIIGASSTDSKIITASQQAVKNAVMLAFETIKMLAEAEKIENDSVVNA